MHEHWRALSMGMLEWKNQEYEVRVWQEWLWNLPKSNLPDGVRSRKRREEHGKIFPSGVFLKISCCYEKENCKIPGQCRIHTISANRKVNTCPGAGNLNLEQVLMPVFSAPTSSALERLKCESKKKKPKADKTKMTPHLKAWLIWTVNTLIKLFKDLLLFYLQLIAYNLCIGATGTLRGQFYYNFNKNT